MAGVQNTLCLAFTPLPLLKPKQLHQKSDQEVCLSAKHAELITQRKRMHQFCSTPSCHLIPYWPNPLTKTCIVANLAVFIFHLQGKKKKKKKHGQQTGKRLHNYFIKWSMVILYSGITVHPCMWNSHPCTKIICCHLEMMRLDRGCPEGQWVENLTLNGNNVLYDDQILRKGSTVMANRQLEN